MSFRHKTLGLPSRTTLGTRTIVPPIIPSYTVPSILEIEANIVASFESMMDVVRAQAGVLHVVLMVDEITAESRIRVDRNLNVFLEICREHGGKTSLKFVNEGDLEELFQSLDDNEVHYAAEVNILLLGHLVPLIIWIPLRPQSHLPYKSNNNIRRLQKGVGRGTCQCPPDHSRCGGS